jgi:hypothetical protein
MVSYNGPETGYAEVYMAFQADGDHTAFSCVCNPSQQILLTSCSAIYLSVHIHEISGQKLDFHEIQYWPVLHISAKKSQI